MENVKEIICENLVSLRKQQKLTQLELAEKINYSDKAISRWEKGEVVPDIETLNKLSELYGVPLSYFFETNTKKAKKQFNLRIGNKMAISLLAVLCVWFIVVVLYAYLQIIMNKNVWTLFVWAIPISFVIAIIFNSIWGKRKWTFIFVSLLIWSLLASVYLQLLPYNIYLIFIIGVPMQVGTILWSCITPQNNK